MVINPGTIVPLLEALRLTLEIIKQIGPIMMAFAKSLGLVNEKENIGDLGDKAIQAEEAGIKPEEYETFQDYVNAIESFSVDENKSISIGDERKHTKGLEILTCLLIEKLPKAPIVDLIALVSAYPKLFTLNAIVKLGKIVSNDPSIIEVVVKYMKGELNNDELIKKALDVIGLMLKEENPNISEEEVYKEAWKYKSKGVE